MLQGNGTCHNNFNTNTIAKPRSFTAFSTLDHTDITTREPIDISLNPRGDCFVYPSVQETASLLNLPNSPKFGARDFQSFAFSKL